VQMVRRVAQEQQEQVVVVVEEEGQILRYLWTQLQLTVSTQRVGHDRLTSRASSLALIILFFLLFLCLSLPLAPSQFVSTWYRLRCWRSTTSTGESSHPIFQTWSRSVLFFVVIIVPSISSGVPSIGELSWLGEFDGFVSRSNGCDSVI